MHLGCVQPPAKIRASSGPAHFQVRACSANASSMAFITQGRSAVRPANTRSHVPPRGGCTLGSTTVGDGRAHWLACSMAAMR
jgi:hypothetical protein